MQRNPAILVSVIVAALVAAIVTVWVVRRDRGGGTDLAGRPATTTATTTATAPAGDGDRAARAAATKPAGPATRYWDVVLATYPKLPATQPLDSPLSLDQAARIVLDDPVNLSPRGDLWITRPDAPPAEAVLKAAVKQQDEQLTLTLRDEVAYVHWRPRPDGTWTFEMVCRKPGGGYEVVTADGSRRRTIPWSRNYRWDRAQEWNDDVIVPTDTGVSIMRFTPEMREHYFDLVNGSAGGAAEGNPAEKPGKYGEPQVLFDWEGIMAWMPWDAGKTGGRGAARYVNEAWTPLGPDQGWPARLLQLLPQPDGSVLQVIANEDGTAGLSVSALEKIALKEDEVEALVADLSHEEEDKRKAAFAKLANYGPGVWPVLEKLLPDEPPEAQARLREIMKSRVLPTLGGMTLLGDAGKHRLRAVCRHRDGGAVYYAEVGVSIPPGQQDDGEEGTPDFRTPAWLDLRPGPSVELLNHAMVNELDPTKVTLTMAGGEWAVTGDARGPRRFIGNGFVPLLGKEEAAFSELVGIDRRGRWIFRKPAATGPGPAAPAGTATASRGPTLILDPSLPDPTPRLPVWSYTTAQVVGWDRNDWPAVKRGGAWLLKEFGWEPLDEKKDKNKLFTKPDEIPPPKAPPAATTRPPAPRPGPTTTTAGGSQPTGKPTGKPAGAPDTAPTPADLGKPILVTEDGTRYYDGKTKLHVVAPDGRQTVWPLPAIANGSGEVHLVRTKEGSLFLFNQPGRVLRIKPRSSGEGEAATAADKAFEVDATFTKRIPMAAKPTRVWLDPAGRIIMAHGNHLAIMFPQGYIPAAIQKMMPAEQLDLEVK